MKRNMTIFFLIAVFLLITFFWIPRILSRQIFSRGLSPAPVPTISPSVTLDSQWSVDQYKRIGSGAALSSVSAIQGHVWAVGYQQGSTHSNTLIEHHTPGSLWQVIPSPNPAIPPGFGGGASLEGIAALTPNLVWAVGNYTNTGNTTQPLIEKWDGSGWKIVSLPTFANKASLNAVAGSSSTNAWAVGWESVADHSQAMILHWNGQQWIHASSPPILGMLNAISVVSATDMWAVGTDFSQYDSNASTSQLLEHWDGRAWSRVPAPGLAAGRSSSLQRIAAVSANDIWALGSSSTKEASYSIIEHWNGQIWQIIASPDHPQSDYGLTGIAIVSATDIWVTGNTSSARSGYDYFLLHWDGSSWHRITSSATPPTNITGAVSTAEGIFIVGATENRDYVFIAKYRESGPAD
jgi:hypothetical protein